MKYEFLLRFFPRSPQDLDALVALDDRVTEALGPAHLVHNHDLWSRYLNIHVHTDDPAAALAVARNVIPADGLGETMLAAYREIGASNYSPLWPAVEGR